jgi:hypothetical protein
MSLGITAGWTERHRQRGCIDKLLRCFQQEGRFDLSIFPFVDFLGHTDKRAVSGFVDDCVIARVCKKKQNSGHNARRSVMIAWSMFLP